MRRGARVAECAGTREMLPKQERSGKGREQGRLDGQTRERTERGALSQQAVATKRGREREGDPGQMPDLIDLNRDTECGATDGDGLGGPQLFM